jgi:hypothetical protein
LFSRDFLKKFCLKKQWIYSYPEDGFCHFFQEGDAALMQSSPACRMAFLAHADKPAQLGYIRLSARPGPYKERLSEKNSDLTD